MGDGEGDSDRFGRDLKRMGLNLRGTKGRHGDVCMCISIVLEWRHCGLCIFRTVVDDSISLFKCTGRQATMSESRTYSRRDVLSRSDSDKLGPAPVLLGCRGEVRPFAV